MPQLFPLDKAEDIEAVARYLGSLKVESAAKTKALGDVNAGRGGELFHTRAGLRILQQSVDERPHVRRAIGNGCKGVAPLHPLGVAVADAARFTPPHSGSVARPFEKQHWPALQMLLADPDGRQLAVEAPLRAATPPGAGRSR